MQITLFSFVTAVLLSSLLIVALYGSRKSAKTIWMLNFGDLACLYLFCLGRMFFSVELPFTVVFAVPSLMNPVADLYLDRPSQFFLLLLLWAAGSVFLLIRLLTCACSGRRAIDRLSKQENQVLQEALEELQRDKKRRIPIRVLCCPGLSTPCGVGLVRRKILLPSREYLADELRHILRHELQHFQTHDLLVKWMIRVFQCLFWWNPLVYLLGRDLDQVLEIKCDLSVTKGYSKKETVAYMRTIKNQLKWAMEMQETVPVGSASLIGNFAMSNVEERFSYIAASLKPTERKELPKPVFAVLFVVLIIVSYSFVLQSSYEAPGLDEHGNRIDYIMQDGIKIRKLKNGTYEQVDELGVVPIPKEIAEDLIEEGAEVIEE